MVDRWPKLVQFTGRVYRSSLRLICYMFEFHVNFSGLIFGSSLRSNLRVFCGNVYGTILRLTLFVVIDDFMFDCYLLWNV